ncbi:MAG: hypothetical protein U5L96_01175 [Owenweeksia sp.]|nr:hypothetical protein [Owenweeksia sp.]
MPQLDYKVENVSVEWDEHIRIDWFVDPSSFTPETEKLFSKWVVKRAKGNEQVFQISLPWINPRM